MKTETIEIKKLVENKGQIAGLPKNPRLIKDERFKKLVKSIQDDPEMLELRECIVVPHEDQFIVIAGNMRLKACKELGHKKIPCKVLDADTPVEKLRAYTVKDNVPFGDHDWDLLANEWDITDLDDWGMELPENDLLEDDGDKEGSENEDNDDDVKAQIVHCPKCKHEFSIMKEK